MSKRTLNKYKVAKGTSVCELEQSILKYVAEGYELVGGVSYFETEYGYERYRQGMGKFS